MTSSAPHLEDRPSVPFIGTTTGVTTTTVAQIADRIPELAGALVGHGIIPTGAPFFRYLEVRGDSMTVQVGLPVPVGADLPDTAVPFAVESGNSRPAGTPASPTWARSTACATRPSTC